MRDRNAPLTTADADRLAWDKMGGLLPAIVQEAASGRVLMLGYMNREALERTLASNLATFWSRSKARLWTKGETSGNLLHVLSVHEDCDRDAVLVRAVAAGPACHEGTQSCFGAAAGGWTAWLDDLSRIVADRAASGDETSYTRRLLSAGPMRIAQKIGEEGVEVALAGAAGTAEQCASETADLLYHLAVLMEARGYSWSDVTEILRARHAAGAAR